VTSFANREYMNAYIYVRLEAAKELISQIRKEHWDDDMVPASWIYTAILNVDASEMSTNIPPLLRESMHLMLCMPRGRYSRTLHQVAMDDIKNDKALFHFLRLPIAQHRGFLRTILSLRSIQEIIFVKVSDP
jgi:hypothetical protein